VRARGGLTDIQFKSDLLSIFWPFREMKQHRRINKAVDGILANEPESEKQMFFTKGDKTPKRGEPGLRKGQRYLLHDFTGCLKPGEMNLVVGRPGSGCSTLLKTLAGLTHAYAGVDGDVRYGAMTSGSRAFSRYRSVVVFNGEDDVHDPNLLVDYTMDFALRMQTPSGRARPLIPGTEKAMSKGRWVAQQKDTILAAFGIQHTGRTKVGDQYVRGVSGGEKKRVSLAEALTADGAIYCWDNATRGLDASTALSFAHLCRTLCDVANRINIVSLYQAGNGIYDLCDKVTVVAEGHIIYFGPRAEARGYFEALGFEHIEGANTADYLTAVTALNERRVRPGFEGRVPSKPSEFATAYRNSDVCARMDAEAAAERNDAAARQEETADMQRYLDAAKAPTAFPFLPYKADVFAQIRACSIREAQVRWGDQWSLWGRQVTTLIQGFVNGSVFYNLVSKYTAIYTNVL
jgi:ABC-type multidrug transport system ATPase subunit